MPPQRYKVFKDFKVLKEKPPSPLPDPAKPSCPTLKAAETAAVTLKRQAFRLPLDLIADGKMPSADFKDPKKRHVRPSPTRDTLSPQC